MKLKKSVFKKVLSLLLVLALTATYLPVMWPATAITGNAYGQTGNKISDPATVNNWKNFFRIDDPNNLNTAYAGGVWTDKSVFNSVAEYTAATDENDNSIPLTIDSNNFLVALSAIASSKSVEGYSSLPSDTILVLDLSASMITNQAVSALVQSANNAISKLQELNANNRVGVVAYSGNSSAGNSATSTAEVILPLGRYNPGLDGNNQSAYLVSSWTTGSGRNQTSHTGVKVANGVTGTIAAGVTSTFSTSNSKDADGGTYIQNGLYQTWKMFSEVRDTTITEGLQAGISRVPVMVLMSDGAPTAATTDYSNVQTSNVGNGTSTYATAGTAFLTQLTASWVRDNMENKYGSTPLVYTLGLGVGDNTAAKNLLDPTRNTATDSYWTSFRRLGSSANKTMNVAITSSSSKTITYINPVGDEWSEDYVTEYFPASNAAGLIQAFNSIVQQIIIQSLYYPTFVEGSAINNDGYLEFDDYIGKNMEVKSVKGIQLGSTLYTGATLARMMYTGGMGTVESPSDVGNNLVWSLQSRLNIPTVQAIRDLLDKAYQTGQLSYDPDTGAYSNYIGWYADQNENFVCFWDGNDDSPDAVPAAYRDQVYYAIKSYMYYDAVGEGHRKTDMMYATIRVSTAVKDDPTRAANTGDVRVLGRLPASLIPLIEYDINLNGIDVLNPSTLTVGGATAPSRLLYEVGLNSHIDLLDIAGTAPDTLTTDADGNYVFYTNQWNEGHHEQGSEFSYQSNKNTISFFEPSMENERYYYTYDTPIYADQNGTLYTGSSAPTGNVYHRSITYKSVNGAVSADYEYERISQHVLTGTGEHNHLVRKNDGSWVVKRGALHHYFADYKIDKGSNDTDTLGVSFMPFVHDDLDDSALDRFHVDFYLGNNGKLTLDPTEGIKITKTADDTLTDKSVDYTFTVTTDASFNEMLRFVVQKADGVRTENAIAFTNGVAGFTLKHGESAWILGAAMTGKTFTVREEPGEGYLVSSVNNVATDSASLTVSANNIPAADFVNTQQQTGSVVIGKAVVSTVDSHQNKAFFFSVSVADNAPTGRTYTILRSDGQTFPVSTGTPATVALTHNQYMTLNGLPVGTTVTATEADYSGEGFTVNTATQTATVTANDTQYLNFQNTYAADPATVNTTVTVGGTKHFISEVNRDANFRFKLQRYFWASGTYEDFSPNAETSVAYTNSKGDKDFSFNFSGESYSAVGTYYYRMIEVTDSGLSRDGIIFDPTPVYFSVVVEDNGAGSLYIANVVAGTDATVTRPSSNTWAVTGEFTNSYAVDGAAKVVLNMQKAIHSDYGVTIPPAGFSFELYESDSSWTIPAGSTPVATSSVTGAGGISDIALVYDDAQSDLGDHYYVIKEHVPAAGSKIPGVDYSTQSYGVKVTVGDSAGLFTVTATTYDLNADPITEIESVTGSADTGVVSATMAAVTFTNTFTPETAQVSIPVYKTLENKQLGSDMFAYKYVKVSVDSSGNISWLGTPQTMPLTAQSSFTVSSDTPGTSYWLVWEDIPAGAVDNRYEGVSYDTKSYLVTVTFTGNNQTGTITGSYTSTLNGNMADIHFVNTYTTDPVSVTLEGTKTLSGDIRKLQANAYSFELLDSTGTVVQTVGNETPIGDYDAFFTFAELTFDTTGTYNYTIREKLPANATAANNYSVHGVQYDTRTYPVTIEVTDPGKGQLSASVTYGNLPTGADIPAFENTYSVSPTSYTIQGTKALTGDAIANHTGANAFEFELYAASWDATSQTVVQGALLNTATNDAGGAFSFDPANISALNFSHIGAYRFILKEKVPANADPLMVYDTSTFHYEVKVTDNLVGGLTTTAKITRVDDRGNATEVNAADVVFSNILKPVPVSVPLGGIKSFNLDLPADTFSFDLYQALKGTDGSIEAVGDPILTAWNQADGNFRFEEKNIVDDLSGLQSMTNYLTFDTAGAYYFMVKENIPDGVDSQNVLNGVQYDATIYTVTITVTESVVNGRTTLSYDMQVTGGNSSRLVFTNIYNASAENGVFIRGEKILTGKDLKDGEFSFGLYNATVDANGNITEGSLVEEVKNAGKNFSFSEIKYQSYTDAGRHYYLLREQIPAGADANGTLGAITYDLKQYLIIVDVGDHGDGTLLISSPSMVLAENGKVTQTVPTEVVFRNVYTPPAPETGDSSQPIFWTVLLSLSILGMGAVLTLGKKKSA